MISVPSDLSRRNLLVGNEVAAGAEAIDVAEISASGFRIAHVSPLLGRTPGEQDEAPGAAEVLVIGYETWQSRFAGDPAILGRVVILGRPR